MGKELSPVDGKISADALAGLDNTKILEKQPIYNVAASEREIKGENNTRIILGRDREHGWVSGYGGKGHTRAGAIDLVVGLQGWAPAEGGKFEEEGNRDFDPKKPSGPWIPGYADKNFGSMNNDRPGDAARIYISQRSDIDNYFGICQGEVGFSTAESAIGMKADSIRIMARKGIKLVTAKNPPGRNSIDGKITATYGIDLIAGNRDVNTGKTAKLLDELEVSYLQPIPKGDNLEQALLQMLSRTERLNNLISSLLIRIGTVVTSLSKPRYGGNAGGPVTTVMGPDDYIMVTKFLAGLQRTSTQLQVQRVAMTALKIDYLNDMGSRYINSRHNRTN
tara:strand:+ start:812 stop:1819 length:1008 start_codon:yes stop_codon:yes gene_type:complete